jgi:hypothetical protein
MKAFVWFRIGILLLAACATAVTDLAAASKPGPSQRFFNLGFTSWPYAASTEAINWVYDAVRANGDLISEHIEEGVPWGEALEGRAFSDDFQNSLNFRKLKRAPGQKLLLSISPLSTGRDGLAFYRGEAINQPLEMPWQEFTFDQQEVKTAYLNYARRMIEFFSPDYFCLGVEVNLLKRNKPELWSSYLLLQEFVYNQLKQEYPNLIMLVSVEAIPLMPGYTDADTTAQASALEDILPYTDILGISLHPCMSNFRADYIPTDLFSRIRLLTDKPLAVTESSYPAQRFTITVNGQAVTFNGSPTKQEDFVKQLLTAANKDQYRFVVWFTIRDYDALWEELGKGDVLLFWRDTGLFDERGISRRALSTWQLWLRKPY